MKIVITCHTEYDLKNKFGHATRLPVPKQSFDHILVLRDLVKKAKIPFTWSLAVGGPCDDRLIKFVAEDRKRWKRTGELGIHFHSEQFKNGQWVFQSHMNLEGYENYWQAYLQNIGQAPKSVVFGKWKVDWSILNQLVKWGIEYEGTAIFKDKMITPPYRKDGIVEVPLLLSFDGRPLNPFTQISHWLYLNKVIREFHDDNVLLHLAFHSYDLFNFRRQKPVLKRQKLIVWENLRRLIKKHGLELMTLSEVRTGGCEDRPYLEKGILTGFFHLFGH